MSRGAYESILPGTVASLRLTLLLLVLIVLTACKRPAPKTDAVALPRVTDESAELLFTWIDDKGEFHVEQRVPEIPVAAREVVRVADPVKDPPKLDDVFVADLRTPGADGAYPVRTMSRSDFEKVAVERRRKGGTVLTPQGASSAPAEAARPVVIVYGASWCGPCHQAEAYLQRRKIPYVKKDIEEDGSAAREMQAKLARAGIRGGSIPVIDVKGRLLIGFDARAIEQALGTTL